jgi:NADH/F420H2 dehydrogenase subunit C
MSDDPQKPSDPGQPSPPSPAPPPSQATPTEQGPVPVAKAAAPPAATPAEKPATPAATPAVPAATPAVPAATPAPAAKPAPAAGTVVPPKPVAKPAAEHPPKAATPAGPSEPPPPADKTPPAFVASLAAAVPGVVSQVSYWVGDWTIIVPAARILDAVRHLRDAPEASFDMCSDVTATDWPARAQRFDLIYCLYSTRHRHRLRVKTRVGESEPVSSVTGVWLSANWLEREVYDMFGVNFVGHPDRRRILMPEDWQGFPERKDYPLEGPGELLMENPLDWLKLTQGREEADIE